jgi:HEAT repeat protein
VVLVLYSLGLMGLACSVVRLGPLLGGLIDSSSDSLVADLGSKDSAIRLSAIERFEDLFDYEGQPNRDNAIDPGEVDAAFRRLGRVSRTVVSAIAECLKSDDREIRERSSAILAKIGVRAKPAVAALSVALRDPDDSVRANATSALSRCALSKDEIIPLLVRMMKDDSPAVRSSADRGMVEQFELATPVLDKLSGEVKRPARKQGEALPRLIEALGDESAGVRRCAAHCLFMLGDEAAAAVPPLKAALRDRDGETGLWSAKALILLNPENPKASSILKNDLIPIINGLAIMNYAIPSLESEEVLLRIGPTTVPTLVKALTGEIRVFPEARLLIIEVLGLFGEKARESAPAVMASMNDNTAVIRCVATKALGRIAPGEEQTVSSLIAALRDKNPVVRRIAAEVLGEIGPSAKAAITPLTRCLHDPSDHVRTTAGKAIESIRRGSP